MRRAGLTLALVLLGAIGAGSLLLGPRGAGPAPVPPSGPLEEEPLPTEPRNGPALSDLPPVLVHGVVLSARDGSPIVGANVSVNPWLKTHQTTTNDRGEWKIEIPPDRVIRKAARTQNGRLRVSSQRLSVRAEGFAGAKIWFKAPPGRDPVAVKPMFLEPTGGSVSGRVVDADGRALPNLPVLVGERIRTTDEDGRFGPVSFTAGEVAVRCRQTVRTVSISGGEAVTMELVVGPQPYVSGRVVDDAGRPVAGVTIRTVEGKCFPVETDEDGGFRCPIPFAWGVRLEAVKEGYLDPAVSHYVEGESIQVVLRRLTSLSGRVVGPDGKPGVGLRVTAKSNHSSDVANVWADSEGRFSVDVWRSGDWRLVVLRDSIPLGVFPVTATLGEPQTDLVLRLPEPRMFRFLVRDALTSAPMEGVALGPWPDGPAVAMTDAEGMAAVPSISVQFEAGRFRIARDGYAPADHYDSLDDPDGVRTIELKPLGRVRLRVLGPTGDPLPGASIRSNLGLHGYSDAEGRAAFPLPAGARVVLEVDHRFAEEAGASVTPLVGETVDAGDIRLPPPTVDLHIRVVTEAGAPIAGARVEAWLSGNTPAWVTDANGSLSIRRRDVSSGSIEVTANGFEIKSLELPKDGDEMRVVLRESARTLGRILDWKGRPVVGLGIMVDGYDASVTDGSGRFEVHGVPTGEMVAIALGDDYDASGWGLVVSGGREAEIRIPGTGEIRIHVGPLPENGLPPDIRCSFLLLDRENLVDGGPIHIGGNMFGPRARRVGEELRYVVPAGRILVRIAEGEAGESLLGPVNLAEGGTANLIYKSSPPGRTRVRFLQSDGEPVTREFVYDAHGGSELASIEEDGWMVPSLDGAYPSGTRRLLIRPYPDAPLVTDPIDLNAGGEVIVKLKPGGGIVGTVHRKDGRPAAGAWVAVLLPPGPFERTTECDAEGRFEILGGVGIGVRTIEVRVDEGPVLRQEVVVNAGEVTRVAIRFPR